MNSQNALISMQEVQKSYEHFCMRDFNLNLHAGEVLGIIGPNGAGKTTCLQMIMGFVQADSGNILVLDKDIQQDCVSIKKEVAYVAEDMRLFGKQTLAWHMAFMQKVFPKWDQNYANHLVQNFHLKAEQKVNQLSLGQRIKATLLLALARKPRILVLDEPSTGLDPVARHELTSQLFQVMLDEEHSVIFSSQFTQDVERISDRIVFIDNGEILSNEDKESYLESWRRISIPIDAMDKLSEFTDIVEKQVLANTCILTHCQFSDKTVKEYTKAKISIKALPMSLEEIFIAQTLYRRNKKSQVMEN